MTKVTLKSCQKTCQTVDIHKINEKETAYRDDTEIVLENADTVSQEGAKEEIHKITKTENGEKK